MTGLRFSSSRFGLDVEVFDDSAMVRHHGKEERWGGDLIAGCALPRIVSADRFDAFIFGRAAICATADTVWTWNADWPIYSIEAVGENVLIVEELALTMVALSGGVIGQYHAADIVSDWAVEGSYLRITDYNGNSYALSQPALSEATSGV